MLGRLSARSLCTVSPQPWLFVGLGNPGDKFKGTRHNVGFEMIDAFAESLGISMDTVQCKAIFGKGFVDGVPVFLAKPQTYMNLSGESAYKSVGPALHSLQVHHQVVDSGTVLFYGANRGTVCDIALEGPSSAKSGPLAAYYKLPLDRVILFYDDMGLPCGVLQLHSNGGHGSHNGLKSVIHHFRGNREFARLRIGIGRPPGQMDPKAFLLQKFNATAQGRIDVALQEGVGALRGLLTKGLTESARCFNTVQKYKHIRLQTMPT